MIKIQLDWSALTGLMEKNDGLVVEIANGVKANFIKTYVKNLLTSYEVESLRKSLIAELRLQVTKLVATTRTEYGQLKIESLNPTVRDMMKKQVSSDLGQLIRGITQEVIKEQLDSEHIKNIVEVRVGIEVRKEVERKVAKRMEAVRNASQL